MPLANLSGSSVAPSISSNPLAIGTGGSKWYENSTVLEAKNAAENALVKVRCLDGVALTDAVTYAQLIALAGTTSASFMIDNDSAGSSIRTGAGSPEGAVTGIVSDLYLQDNGADADSIAWIKVTGSGNTGWQKIYTTGVPSTTSTTFQLDSGGSGIKLKHTSTTLEARNAADNAYVIVRGLTPVGNADLVTKLFHDGEDAQNIKIISVAYADPAGTFTSTATIPANSRVVRVDKALLTEVFNNSPTVTVGYSGSLSAFAGTSDTDLTSTAAQILSINKASDSTARAVIVTVGGTPSQGAGTIYVHYIETVQT